MSYNARQTQTRGHRLLRLMLITLWLLAMGTNVSRADDNASTEEILINFADHSELLDQLGNQYTDWNASNQHVETKLHNYDVVLDHCLGDNDRLKIRGDYKGYVQGTIPGQVTTIVFNKVNNKRGNINVILNEGKDNEQTIPTSVKIGAGTVTIDIPEAQQVKDASIKIVPDFQLEVTSLTLVRLATGGA